MTRRKKFALGLVVGLVVFAMGIASAAFLASVLFSNGAGQGASGKTTGGPLNVTAGASPSSVSVASLLSPGQSAPLYINVNNGSGAVLKLTTWTHSGTITSAAGGDGTCDLSQGANLIANDLVGLNISVPQGVSVVAIPAAVSMVASPQPGCSNLYFQQGGTATFGF